MFALVPSMTAMSFRDIVRFSMLILETHYIEARTRSPHVIGFNRSRHLHCPETIFGPLPSRQLVPLSSAAILLIRPLTLGCCTMTPSNRTYSLG
jgi:hypothetical protein